MQYGCFEAGRMFRRPVGEHSDVRAMPFGGIPGGSESMIPPSANIWLVSGASEGGTGDARY